MKTRPRVEMREATLADCGALGHIWVDSWQVAYRGLLPETYLARMRASRVMARYLARMLNPRRHSTLVVATGPEPLSGTGSPAVALAEFGQVASTTAELFTFYVHPDRWRLGIGTALMRRLVERLRDNTFARLRLWVLAANRPARDFYHALGFRPTVRRRWETVGGVRVPSICYQRSLT